MVVLDDKNRADLKLIAKIKNCFTDISPKFTKNIKLSSKKLTSDSIWLEKTLTRNEIKGAFSQQLKLVMALVTIITAFVLQKNALEIYVNL